MTIEEFVEMSFKIAELVGATLRDLAECSDRGLKEMK